MAKTILVADDEPRIVQLVDSMLSRAGYRVVSAANGREALERVAEAKPDLILLDILMPEIDGTVVAQTLREQEDTSAIPVVFLTSLVDGTEVEREGPEIGGHLFLAKPFKFEELLSVIKHALG